MTDWEEVSTYTVCDGFDAMGGCSRCERPVTVGEPGWTWHSWRRTPGYFFASVGSDNFYCPECSDGSRDEDDREWLEAAMAWVAEHPVPRGERMTSRPEDRGCAESKEP